MNHNIEPVYDKNCKILILGSFPSAASRQAEFFYAHPQNRFWRVLSAVTGQTVPDDAEGKKRFLLKNHIALWDVIGECDVKGSSDSTIRNAKANDISKITSCADIKAVFLNGRLAEKLYNKYIVSDIKPFYLPSTSPANASFSFDKLVCEWSVISSFL